MFIWNYGKLAKNHWNFSFPLNCVNALSVLFFLILLVSPISMHILFFELLVSSHNLFLCGWYDLKLESCWLFWYHFDIHDTCIDWIMHLSLPSKFQFINNFCWFMVYLILGKMFNYHFLKIVSIQLLPTSRGNKTNEEQEAWSLFFPFRIQFRKFVCKIFSWTQ